MIEKLTWMVKNAWSSASCKWQFRSPQVSLKCIFWKKYSIIHKTRVKIILKNLYLKSISIKTLLNSALKYHNILSNNMNRCIHWISVTPHSSLDAPLGSFHESYHSWEVVGVERRERCMKNICRKVSCIIAGIIFIRLGPKYSVSFILGGVPY